MVTSPADDIPEQVAIRHDKLAAMYAAGIKPYPSQYNRSHLVTQLQTQYQTLESDAVTTDVVRVAGRLMGRRNQGKIVFADLVDDSGKIQLALSLEALGNEAFKQLSWLDLGDVIGIEGTIRRTKRGELSVGATQWTMLAKCLRPLGDKWNGITDVELRYRQRYLDMILDPSVRTTFKQRAKVLATLRHTLNNLDFIEAETPMLQAIPGGAAARPFNTRHNALDLSLHLRISPELHLKRLIVGGFERVYDMGKVFRNEGISTRHNPEFTMLEVYQAYADYNDIMNLTEELVCDVLINTLGTLQVPYQGTALDFTRPWARKSMSQLVDEALNVEVARMDIPALQELAAKVNARKPTMPTHGHLVNEIFEATCESALIQPIFVIDHPVEISPLARCKSDDETLTERFEVFVAGRELGNGFSELNDPADQRRRFEAQMVERCAGNDEAHSIDEDYLHALSLGMPPTGGVGIGVDRLAMLVVDAASIRDVILFPLLRPQE